MSIERDIETKIEHSLIDMGYYLERCSNGWYRVVDRLHPERVIPGLEKTNGALALKHIVDWMRAQSPALPVRAAD